MAVLQPGLNMICINCLGTGMKNGYVCTVCSGYGEVPDHDIGD